ncbi:MAG: signal recognition particle-docking protein FtsY [Clostridia bacterium]|nr:signal recognition particle-docking protein FtsY [Clostridia bacterium]
MGLFARLFGRKKELTEEFYDELTEQLIASDMGVMLAEDIIDELRDRAKHDKIKKADDCRELLKDILIEHLPDNDIEYKYPLVITVIGVNGVGKTTTIAKLANYFNKNKKSVLLAAGDTFRAAASEQLTMWANRLKVRIVAQGEGADPASVVFDAIESAKAKNVDVLIVDTAGRLHTKTNLMAELQKMDGIVEKRFPEAMRLSLIVLDASIGQNSVAQVKAFKESARIDGIVLTKLDGTAKGGIAFPILNELNIPIMFLCNGETVDDIREFDAEHFVDNIL